MITAERLNSLTVENLKSLVDFYRLEAVKKNQKKDNLITDILNSPTISKDGISDLINSLLDEFISGGKSTLSLFKLITENRVNFDALSIGDEIMYKGEKFKLKSITKQNDFTIIEWTSPGVQRTYTDYYKGTLEHTPITETKVLVSKLEGGYLLDIRAPKKLAKKLANLVSMQVLGKSEFTGGPSVLPHLITFDRRLVQQLKAKFDARLYKIKVNQDDEIDSDNIFHPRSAELTSSSHDFDDVASNLQLQTTAEYTAEGLSFSLNNDKGFQLMPDCRIWINFNSHQVTFLKTSPIGAYRIVINAILEP